MPLHVFAVSPHALHELPGSVQLCGPARTVNQPFRGRFNRTTSTVGTFIRDCLSAASTEVIRLQRFDCGYPDFALGLSTTLLADCKQNGEIPINVVFPSQFARLLIEYQEHAEAKSLAPDGTPCEADTRGLLGRAHVVAGELRYIGKETDRKWEEGDDVSISEFAGTEYTRSARVIASEEIKNKIMEIGINKCARESGFDRKNFIRKLIRGLPVKRNSYNEFLRWLQSYKSRM
jgi:hypothetical protein